MQTTPNQIEKLSNLFDFLCFPHNKASSVKKAQTGLVLANLIIILINPSKTILERLPVRLQALDNKTILNLILLSKESTKS